ncbi:ScbR family autoregulator-binding transcription factor [Streptomyces sp. H10-C2]|uniref:ScbR family autoregulator-binding transcription factor n=1 Tax=unclassified Streptomyces TaxID=2593676 RepID=UPI0024B8A669|nr:MULTISPECIES: ScbR family autoregulator-binding transcription factor [unclassified Streptomyces]MDJ0346716.1 ScbR family autoregulator-binding transcription factor [Streptomyces sp. PH10-H1]MDJ0375166.1 ScbR family autoregulator-binding transcription factor [Streptomyces sp. H10-C2]
MVKQERAEYTLRRIVLAASEQFDSGGYSRTSLDTITKAAGVSKGAFYFHFSSKDQLAEAVQRHSRDLFDDLMEELGRFDESPLQVLIDSTHGLTRLLASEPSVRASIRIARERTRLEQPSALDFYRAWREEVRQLLRTAAQHKELRAGIVQTSTEVLASAMVSCVETLSWLGVPPDDASRRLTELWDILLPAITPVDHIDRFRTSPPVECGVTCLPAPVP